MAKQLPIIIQRLKDGFTTISVAAFETVEIFRELQECHLLVLKERPEPESEVVLEVPDDEYEEFKRDQDVISEWNRADLESALLEESIERSLNRSETETHAYDDNQNILTGKKDLVRDATMVKAAREREIIDNELKEARDAYEQALKEHQEKKQASTPKNDNADFMTQFFQDPEFIQKQYEGKRDIAHDDDSLDKLIDDAIQEDVVGDNIFDQMLAEHLSSAKDTQKVADGKVDSKLDNKVERNQIDNKLSESEVGHSITIIEDSKIPQPIASSSEAIARNEQFKELSDQQITDCIARLKVGLWVDMYQNKDVNVRAKIMAIVPSVGKYIFGDRGGRKLADYDIDSLTVALRIGEIRVSEEDTVFDKTLESVIANLRTMKKAEDE